MLQSISVGSYGEVWGGVTNLMPALNVGSAIQSARNALIRNGVVPKNQNFGSAKEPETTVHSYILDSIIRTSTIQNYVLWILI